MGIVTLLTGLRNAMDGFEDAFGFHFGITPAVDSLFPSASQSFTVFEPASIPRAAVPRFFKSRRKSASKPPLLPTNLDAKDLNPTPVGGSKPSGESAPIHQPLAAREQHPPKERTSLP
ncbi:MAG TPA: hypothetical protein VHS96_01635 [Bacteroidia bacterium]|nr:hypothetical protein [Bacteroidia bacterium]